LSRLKGVVCVGDKEGCATAKQKRNEDHGRFSSGNTAKYLLRDRSQISSRMTCMAPSPILVNEGRIGDALFQHCFVGLGKWLRQRTALENYAAGLEMGCPGGAVSNWALQSPVPNAQQR
jgi:hypothetical protein